MNEQTPPRMSVPPADRAGQRDRDDRPGHSLASAQLTAFGAVLVAAILLITSYSVWNSRQAALGDVERELVNLNQVLAEHADSTVRGIDLVLQGTAEWIRGLTPSEQADPTQLHRLLRIRLAGYPAIRVLAVFHPDGHVWLNTYSDPPPPFYFPEEPYITAHRDRNHAGLYIALPRKTKIGDRWSLFFSRALRDGDGRLQAVVVALVDPQYFVDAFRRIHLGESNAISLLHSDGFLLTRYPLRDEWMGKDLRSHDLFRQLLEHADRGVVHTEHGVDGVPRIISSIRLADFPLVVNVTITREAALRKWRVGALEQAAVAGGTSLAAVGLLVLLGGQIRRQEATGRQLRESEERLRLALQGATDAVWDWNLKTGRVYFSPRWYTMLGYEPDAFPAGYESWRRLLHPDDAEAAETALQAHIAGSGNSFAIEFRMRERMGGWRWILGRGMVVERDAAGDAVRLAGSHSDISERKRAEENLRLTQLAMDRSSDGIFRVDPDGRFGYVNEQACRSLGYSRDELLGLHVWEIDPDFPDTQWPSQWETLQQTGRRVFESRHRRKDGSTFPVEISANHLRLGERDVHIAYARDITERKLAEQALRESEDKFRTLFENMTEAVALHDLVRDADGRAADYRILEVNPAYTRHAGISAESARGRLGSELYRSDPAPFLEEFARVALIGEPYLFEAYLPQLQRHFRISAISPKQGQFATVFEDITERRQREAELQQKTDELTRFTYTVSHDLKSPLVTIKTFLGFLDEDLRMQDHERIAKDIGFMRNAADKMTRLLDELIELSRIGRVVNAPVDVTLQALVKEALDLVAGRITERGVAVQVTEVPVTLHGDRSRLIEVFQNLLDNAVKFMGDQAQPRIAIEVEDTGKELVVVVTDNGIGIDPRHIHKLFGLFEKLDPGADGTGIGLALIKRIIEFHGGRIWVESPGLGRGTTFRFTVADMQRAA